MKKLLIATAMAGAMIAPAMASNQIAQEQENLLIAAQIEGAGVQYIPYQGGFYQVRTPSTGLQTLFNQADLEDYVSNLISPIPEYTVEEPEEDQSVTETGRNHIATHHFSEFLIDVLNSSTPESRIDYIWQQTCQDSLNTGCDSGREITHGLDKRAEVYNEIRTRYTDYRNLLDTDIEATSSISELLEIRELSVAAANTVIPQKMRIFNAQIGRIDAKIAAIRDALGTMSETEPPMMFTIPTGSTNPILVAFFDQTEFSHTEDGWRAFRETDDNQFLDINYDIAATLLGVTG